MTEPQPKRQTPILPLIVMFLGVFLLIAGFLFWNQANQVASQPAAQPVVVSPVVELTPTLITQSNTLEPTLALNIPRPTSTPITPVGGTQAIVLPRFDEPSFPDVPRVSLSDAKAAYNAKSAIFVDVRGKDAYDLSHVTGAINIPLAEIPARAKELDPHAWIITYCT